MRKEEFDVVVIGSGIAGLITGAILAQKERLKVLVLEKNRCVGGRFASWGKQHGSDYSAAELEEMLLEETYATILRAEPSLKTMIKNGLLKDWIVEGGWRAISGGDRNRFALIARSLGKRIAASDSVGFNYWRQGRFMNLTEIDDGWSRELVRERSRVAYERQLISIADSHQYDHVGLGDFMESVTDSPEVRRYYYSMATYQTAYTDPSRISAGEWIRCNNAAGAMGKHLVHGGGVGIVTGGFRTATDVFASIIRENGGEIRTRHRVREVVINNWVTRGVVVETGKGREEILARNVVCNPPVYQLSKIIPDKYLIKDLKERIGAMSPMPALCGYLFLREPLEKKCPAGEFTVEEIPGTEHLRRNGHLPAFGFEQQSGLDPSRAPKGKCLVGFAALPDPDSLHDRKYQEGLCDAMVGFFRSAYPHLENIMEGYWMNFVGVTYAIPMTPELAGDRRFPVKHPLVKGLFFTGDTVEQWDMGSSGAAHGAVLAANALTGRDYLHLLPPYWR